MNSDQEISKTLALVIGWTKADVILYPNDLVIVKGKNIFRRFDYRDWNIIGPIAERYSLEVDFHLCGACSRKSHIWYYRDTVQEAIAACVIGAKK